MACTCLSRAFWIFSICDWTAVSIDLPFLKPFWASKIHFQIHNLFSFKNRVFRFFLLPSNYSWLITKMSMTFHNKQKTFPSLVKLVPCHTAWHVLGLQIKDLEFRYGGWLQICSVSSSGQPKGGDNPQCFLIKLKFNSNFRRGFCPFIWYILLLP
jgi:hypothetical protein